MLFHNSPSLYVQNKPPRLSSHVNAMNLVVMADQRVHIHIQLGWSVWPALKNVLIHLPPNLDDCFLSLILSCFCTFSFRFVVAKLCYWIARALCSTRRSPGFITVSCQWISRRTQAFMFASKAFSSRFIGFLVDEKASACRSTFHPKTGKLKLGLPKKSKALVKRIRN